MSLQLQSLQSSFSLASFHYKRLLSENTRTKTVFLLGEYGETDPQPAILICSKTHFTPSEVPNLTVTELTHVTLQNKNDVYHYLESGMTEVDHAPRVTITLIYPATDAVCTHHVYEWCSTFKSIPCSITCWSKRRHSCTRPSYFPLS
jgi:hypothetical protein